MANTTNFEQTSAGFNFMTSTKRIDLMTSEESTVDFGNGTTLRPADAVMFITDGATIAKINASIVKKFFVPALTYVFLMMVIGATGNALVFYVYSWKWRKSTARIFILALAICDMINCFLTIPMEITFTFRVIMFDVPAICKLSRFITFWMNNCSSFVLVGIVIDRYWRICRPLQPQMTTHQAKRAVIVAVVLGFVFSWPALIIYGTQTLKLPLKPNVIAIGKSCIIEDKFLTADMKNYPLSFTSVLLIGNVGIDIFFVIAYVLIGLQVLRHGQFTQEYSKRLKLRKGSTSSAMEDDEEDTKSSGGSILSRLSGKSTSGDGSPKPTKNYIKADTLELKEKRANFAKQRSLSAGSQTKTANERRARAQRTTFMLSLVTLLFVLSFIPYCVLVILRYVSPVFYFKLSDSSKAVYQVFFRSYLLSSALNPVIYSFVNAKFRKECRKALKALVCRK